jgi:hypothetical protein
MKKIEEAENRSIERLLNSNKNIFIAASPHFHTRQKWGDYLNKVNPYIVYLKKDSESIYKDLLKRRKKHKKIIDINHPNFDTWDIGVMVNKDKNEFSKE